MRTITNKKTPSNGFTLIELSVVILIIGLLMAFVLAASASSLESARVRATQSLITKISTGLEDRMEALLTISVSPNAAHQFLASIPVTKAGFPSLTQAQIDAVPLGRIEGGQRAEVLARLDQIRAELPDVFFLDPSFGGSQQVYPINFCGRPFPAGQSNAANYILPLGQGVNEGTIGTGINGASYAAAASLYKLIGYTPRGYDGVDNNGNDLVDDIDEGIHEPDGTTNNPEAVLKVTRFRENHQHKTARSEMLYAILVEGIGPFGSVFSTEDFRESEIKDTDNDGVPEFVDGWGEPIQFFRAPYWHRSGGESFSTESNLTRPVLQKGNSNYAQFEPRRQDALDSNGQLVSLGWWARLGASSYPAEPSANCQTVMSYFGPLVDPHWPPPSGERWRAWDRSGASPRRSYFTKFLLISGGPDREIGVPMLTNGQAKGQEPLNGVPGTSTLQITNALSGIVIYNNGFELTPGEGWGMLLSPELYPKWYAGLYDQDVSLDDITSQNLLNQAGGLQ